jgi:leader peptidase (prepilin peptidase) / N-methyltransferase
MIGVTTAAGASLAGGLGLLIGSFLNVVAYRLPRGESLSVPASHCPGCDTPIKPYDNIPVLSWLLLRGRCRSCKQTIPWRYPAIELGTALLLALTVVILGADKHVWLGLALVLLLVPITVIDLDHQIIPNKLTILGAVLAPVILVLTRPEDIPEHVIAAFAASGFLLLAIMIRPGGMGLGDVKLTFVLGLFLGRDVIVALFVAFLAGSLIGGMIMARVGVAKGRKTKVPFGPFLALGGIVALYAGDPIVDWYLNTFA